MKLKNYKCSYIDLYNFYFKNPADEYYLENIVGMSYVNAKKYLDEGKLLYKNIPVKFKIK